MVPKSKTIIKEETISIEDVIGMPGTGVNPSGQKADSRVSSQRTSHSQVGEGSSFHSKSPASNAAHAPSNAAHAPSNAAYAPSQAGRFRNGMSFVPRLVSSPPPSSFVTPPVNNVNNSSNNNHTDRYSSTPTKTVVGFLDIMPEGHGFLRPKFIPGEGDIYISQSQIRKFQLREGDEVEGQARLPKENERYLGLLKVEKVNKKPADDSLKRPHFESLTPIYPNKQIVLETGKTPISTRIIDLMSPIGFGQRGMIVSPPKAGKTTIIKEIAHGISENYPKAHLMAVLIGERPEEVTDIERSVKGEVISSNFDEAPEAQTKVAEVGLARAKRLIELGFDVIVLLDSITRLARAYNLSVMPSGRTLSGGFDPAALYPAKKFLGAARQCEKGGSLTILGTALIETGSRMDDLIYEEFKGTGNMELHLSRFLQEQRVFPAIDLDKSGTRHEELLLAPDVLKKVVTLRHMLSLLREGQERTGTVIDRLLKTRSNKEFLASLNKG